jgi:SAM-dependent methyltransferase
MVMLQLPPRGMLSPNSEVDPFRYYYTPVLGRIFSARLQIGLDLLEGHSRRLLEIGYGSGLLIPTLSRISDELYGIDLMPEPPGLRGQLTALGVANTKDLVQTDVAKLPFADGFFDVAVAFSIFEHLKKDELVTALAELARVLEPGGRLLVGCPAVHPLMNAAFAAIGFRNIEDHHFSSITDVMREARDHFSVEKRSSLPRLLDRAPAGWAPYSAVLFRKK